MERARETKSTIVYVNQVGAQDELVFDGSSVVVSANGDIVSRLKSFDSDFVIVDIAEMAQLSSATLLLSNQT